MLFLKAAVRVLIGIIVLAIGVGARWDQTTRKAATEAALVDLGASVAAGLPVLSPEEVTEAYDGQPVFVQGELAPGSVHDPLSGLSLDAVWLKRTVELEQWKEDIDCTRTSVSSSRSCRYSYHKVWSAKLIDSDGFSSPLFGESEHENPNTKPSRSRRSSTAKWRSANGPSTRPISPEGSPTEVKSLPRRCPLPI